MKSGPVDLIITNGRIYTGSADRSQKPLRFAATRSCAWGQTVRSSGCAARRPSCSTRTAEPCFPGFNDAHVHLLDGGLSLSQVNLSDAAGLDTISERVREYAAEHPDKPWIVGQGWQYPSFPGGLPTRQQLDALVPDRPAFIYAFDGHTAWVNSKALALAAYHAPYDRIRPTA